MLEEIRCLVLKALPEIMIVSYETPEKRIFQGALLNVSNPFPVEELQEKIDGFNSKDFSPVCKRHTYFQLKQPEPQVKAIAAKKLGVRLRARQVLCNNCKNSCTETGETVQPKRSSEKENHQERSDVERRTRGKTPQSGPSTSLEQQPVNDHRNGTLVPRVYRLTPDEIGKYLSSSACSRDEAFSRKGQTKKQPLKIKFANSGKGRKIEEHEDFPRQDSNDTAELKYPYSQRFPKNGQPNKSQENEELNDVPNRSASPATRTRSMRRKRQAQKPIEELSENDEADTVEASQSGATDSGPYSEGKVDVSPPRTTPVLKISFGHGSVMKIKAKLNGPSEQAFPESVEDCPSSYVNSGEKLAPTLWQSKSPRYSSFENSVTAKAARKALKRARKEAQRRGLHPSVSPSHLRTPSSSASPSSNFDTLPDQSSLMNTLQSSNSHSASNDIDTNCVVNFPSNEELGTDECPRRKHKKKKHKKKKLDTDDDDQSVSKGGEAFEEVNDISTSDRKDVILGSVVWGQTSNSLWWPAKVTGVVDSKDDSAQVQVSWYSNVVENTSNAKLPISQIRSFREHFEKYHEQSLNDPAFLTAVWLATEDVKIVEPCKATITEFADKAMVLSP